ncbi:radical SAM protein [Flavobacterium sp. CBA20B-1]|uniref:radical SAM protein n=1 Tax=unclassified Flavobacterium TaxID=196869 RepID=UPI002224EA52|nr:MULTISPECIES: radical SAM protein [unclassified Flavobacterium]WCM41030.1 radical SAM protein [Flavobacterium sp. CBA20B-1]
MPTRKYTYYDYTISLCPECLKRIDAKIVFEDEKVYMLKRCPEHGNSRVLIADDIAYYKNIRNYNKPSETPYKFNTKTHYGCPYDCGLCPDHEQHSCLTIIEITDRCNLTCPTCYAGSSPTYGRHRTLAEVKTMLDTIVANEKEPDVVQISGGEPTLHPQFFEILDYAKSLPIKHLMVNTNGLLIAKDFDFAKRLKSYAPDFEIYLQFDSFKEEALYQLRGANLKKIREKALEHLNELNLSTTLVVTLQKGLNDDEMGEIIDYALQQQCVRGVTFQPTQIAGRLDNFNHETDRITLTEVRRKILEQSTIFSPDDIIPVPCNPDALAMGYVLKLEGNNIPLTRYINPTDLLDNSKNTIVYEQDEALHQKMFEIFSTGTSTDKASDKLHQLLCCLPFVEAPNLGYDNLFRIIIMQFIDAHNFDVRAIKKSCVHIVNKDNTIIPFETMNLFYRDDKIERLKALQNETKL